MTNAQKNTFLLIEMSGGVKGTGFDSGKKFNGYVEGTVGVHKAVLPDVTIQWGDGKTSRVTASGLAKYTYAKKGKYTVTITGRLPQLGWGVVEEDGGSRCDPESTTRTFPGIEKLVAVQSFGVLDTHRLAGAFAGAASLTEVPDVLPPTVTNLSNLFNGARTFNDNIARWNTSNVTDMSAMFCGATSFNQPLEKWNVSNVTYMGGMFYGASVFNQPLAQWNVSQVTSMWAMFKEASAYNQPLARWNVSNVTDMRWMFSGASSFNQPLEKWNVSQVTEMGGMFHEATAFNQPLERWNVSNVTSMSWMFVGATSFNQPLAQWDVSKVTDMNAMFGEAKTFNQPLAQWDVSQVINMGAMFSGATAFNQPLEKWNVSTATDMSVMFWRAEAFNQPLEQWNVSKVTDMSSMFSGATAFNQPLEQWNVSRVTEMDSMFNGATSFDQDVSRWCVRAIKTEPENFSLNASNWKKAKPQWGTCLGPDERCSACTTPVTIIITNEKGEIAKQWEQAAKDFSASNPDIAVKVYSKEIGDSLTVYEDRTKLGEVVTLAMFEPGSLLLNNNEIGIDLSEEKWVQETTQVVKDATGKAVGFPFSMEGYGIVYNKAVVEKAVGGAFDPYSINTRNKLIELLDKVRASGVTFPVAYQTESWSVGNHYGSLFLNQGGDPVTTLASLNNGELKLKDNATWNGLLDTMDVLASEKYNKFGKRPLGKLYDEAHELVGSGKSAFLFNGNWAYDSLKALPESDFGFIPIPVDNDASNVMNTKLSAGPTQALVVNKAATPAQQDAAKRFLNWIVYERAGQDFLVTKSQVIPAFKNITRTVTNPLGKAVGAAVKEGKTMPFSTNYINAGDYMEKIGPEVQKYIEKKITRKQLAKAYEDYHATLKK